MSLRTISYRANAEIFALDGSYKECQNVTCSCIKEESGDVEDGWDTRTGTLVSSVDAEDEEFLICQGIVIIDQRDQPTH